MVPRWRGVCRSLRAVALVTRAMVVSLEVPYPFLKLRAMTCRQKKGKMIAVAKGRRKQIGRKKGTLGRMM